MSRGLWTLGQMVAVALWLGAAVFFAAAVAPALFATLPSRTLAGTVVSRLLPTIFYSGMLIAAVVAALTTARDGWHWRGPQSAAVVMLGACAVAQMLVAPRIERVRAQISGPVDALAPDDARRVAFGRLHGISVGWLGVAMLAGVVVLVLFARLIPSRQT